MIVPAYNTSQYIAEALDSVLGQTYQDYEIIVINDGSPDTPQLEEALKPYGDAVRYMKKENGGAASARNAGIRLARGEFVVMLDSDDIWLPEYLARQMAAITASPEIAVSYTNAMLFGDSPLAGKDFMSIFPSDGEVTFRSMIEEKVHVVGTSMARRDAIIEAGLYDETLPTSEDFDLWLRIAHRGWRIVYTKDPLFRYRRRAGCLSDDQVGFWSSFQRAMEKIDRTMDLSPGERALVEDRLRYIRAMLNLYEGKQAFFEGKIQTAISSLSDANTYMKSSKISLALGILRVAPRLALGIYEARDRFIYKKDTKA
ncbi:MAG: glycosyltransferase family 2 protein [Blastocatellia bacterium]